jgi:hypothetical protein
MTAVPANINIDLQFKDVQGYQAVTRVVMHEGDVSTDGLTVGGAYTAALALAAAVQAASNAKLTKVGFSYYFDYAQGPTSESGHYELTSQKSRMLFGDGNGGFESMQIPAPVDTLFLTTGSGNLTQVNEASALITAIQTAGATYFTYNYYGPRQGTPLSAFYGGHYTAKRLPRRTPLVGK